MLKKQQTKNNRSGDLRQEIRDVGALVEQTNHNVQALAEQMGTAHKKLGALAEEFVDVHKKLDNHTKILDSHSKTLDSHTEMIGDLMTDMTTVKDNVEFLKAGMRQKVDKVISL